MAGGYHKLNEKPHRSLEDLIVVLLHTKELKAKKKKKKERGD